MEVAELVTVLGIDNGILIVIIAIMLKWFDSRNAKRGKEKDKEADRFNRLMLKGQMRIGKIAVLTANKLAGQDINGGLEKAISAYDEYCSELEGFKLDSIVENIKGCGYDK